MKLPSFQNACVWNPLLANRPSTKALEGDERGGGNVALEGDERGGGNVALEGDERGGGNVALKGDVLENKHVFHTKFATFLRVTA